MADKSLEQFYAEHSGKVSDRWGLYLVEYERILGGYRDKPVALLEIGLQNGGSLEIWARFFSKARQLVGCDINPDCARLVYEDPRIHVVVGDANSDVTEAKVLRYAPTFDVVIDDGSHNSSDIVKSFARYFPHLAQGGIFVVEDLHCSYWEEYEGGLFDPFSAISLFKRLADIVNYEHWGVAKSRSDVLSGFFSKYDCELDEAALERIHSIEFVNSMCVIRKDAPEKNSLGARIVAGADEQVEPADLARQCFSSLAPSQENNEWATRVLPPEEEVLRLEKSVIGLAEEISERDKHIANDNRLLAERERQLAAVHNSTSWRITRPARLFSAQIRKLLRLFDG